MPRDDLSLIKSAYTAAIAGDVEPLVALLGPDLEWRGVQKGRLWWRHTPS